jgi:prolyl-tRNA synthetase
MRMSRLFSQTLREAPADAEVASHILLVRAGFIRQLASGIFSYLPLAQRSITKIENILRQEMDAIDGQEITMPVVHPADIWKETGRWYDVDAEMGRFCDRSKRDMVLAMTHEEVVADLVRKEIKSYRQLPQMIYHIQTKWRDDPRPRSGMLRVREFTMKDSYSLDADQEGLVKQYEAHYEAYFKIFRRCGLPTRAVKADVGMMGGSQSDEFMYLTPVGEDTILLCDKCDYSANGQIALFAKEPAAPEAIVETNKIATPNTSTIEDLASLLGIPTKKTAKVVLLVGRFKEDEPGAGESERLVMAIIRGDMAVSETKLANSVKALGLRPAREEEISTCGAVPGYASPIGLGSGVLVVADDSIPATPNLVAGANEAGYHLEGVNYGRDFEADMVADIAAAGEGSACSVCGTALSASRGVEVGNIFQLGTKYTDAMGCTYLDADGVAQSVVMGSYGIGVGRLLACIAEEHRDENGLMWPLSVAPYQVHLVVLAKNGAGPAADAAEKIYAELTQADVEVLYDDRSENPGVKFKDADLIGIPLRITVGERSLKEGQVEVKGRAEADSSGVAVDDVVEQIEARISSLWADLA